MELHTNSPHTPSVREMGELSLFNGNSTEQNLLRPAALYWNNL